jgi:hypothetical protein
MSKEKDVKLLLGKNIIADKPSDAVATSSQTTPDIVEANLPEITPIQSEVSNFSINVKSDFFSYIEPSLFKYLQDFVSVIDEFSTDAIPGIGLNVEITVIFDDISFSMSKNLYEVFSVSDSSSWVLMQPYQESIVSTDTYTLTIGKANIESISLQETTQYAVGKHIFDNVAVLEYLSKVFSTAFGDSVSSSDTLSLAYIFNRLYQDTVAAYDELQLGYGKAPSETILASDSLVNFALSKVLVDYVDAYDLIIASGDGETNASELSYLIDFLSLELNKHLTQEAVEITDSVELIYDKRVEDTFSNVDALTFYLSKILEDSLSITDVAYVQIGKNSEDIISVQEYISNLFEKVLDDTVSTTDLADFALIMPRVYEDTLTAIDTVVKSIEPAYTDTVLIGQETLDYHLNKTLLDSIYIYEDLQVSGEGTTTKTDNTFLVDLLSYQLSKDLSLESISLLDSIALTYGKTFAEFIESSDTAVWNFGKNPLDTISLTDSAYVSVGKNSEDSISLEEYFVMLFTKMISEEISVSEFINLAMIFARVYEDTLSVSDVVSKSIQPSREDSIGVTEEFVNYHLTKVLLDYVDAYDEFSATGTGSVNPNESAFISDLLHFSMSKQLSPETVSVLDLIALTYGKTYEESAEIIDSLYMIIGKSVQEDITVFDQISSLFGKTLVDTAILDDTLIKLFGKVLPDSVTMSDAISLAMAYVRVYQDTALLSDSIIKSIQPSKEELLGISENIVSFALSKVITDYVDVYDDIVSNKGSDVYPNETAYIVETVVIAMAKLLSQETIGVTDSIALTYGRIFAEVVGLTDTQVRSVGKSLTDTRSVTDVMTRSVGKSLTDTRSVTDVMTRSVGFTANAQLQFYDDFNRANGVYDRFVDTFYAQDVEFQIIDNRLTSSSGVLQDRETSKLIPLASHVSEARVKFEAYGYSDEYNYFSIQLYNNNYEVNPGSTNRVLGFILRNSGIYIYTQKPSFVQQAFYSYGIPFNGEEITLEYIGNTAKVYINNLEVLSWIDSSPITDLKYMIAYFYYESTFIRSYVDNLAVYNLSVPFDDRVLITDNMTCSAAKFITDSISVTDTFNHNLQSDGLTNNRTDSASISESGFANMQNYTTVEYFDGDYVGTNYNF